MEDRGEGRKTGVGGRQEPAEGENGGGDLPAAIGGGWCGKGKRGRRLILDLLDNNRCRSAEEGSASRAPSDLDTDSRRFLPRDDLEVLRGLQLDRDRVRPQHRRFYQRGRRRRATQA